MQKGSLNKETQKHIFFLKSYSMISIFTLSLYESNVIKCASMLSNVIKCYQILYESNVIKCASM